MYIILAANQAASLVEEKRSLSSRQRRSHRVLHALINYIPDSTPEDNEWRMVLKSAW